MALRLENIDLNLFVVFDALYRERNVTRVASQLNLTQPAVSSALNRLRQTFDDALFVRSPDGMLPTPVADNVVGDVRRAMELLRKSVKAQHAFDAARSEKIFRVGMNDMAEYLLLPALHRAVAKEAPHVSVRSYYVARETAAEELKAGRIDLLLDAPITNARQLQSEPLAHFPYRVAMRRDHPLAGRRISLQRYLAADHLHVSSRRSGRGHVDLALNRLGKQRRVALRVQNHLAAARVASNSDLLWTAPDTVLAELPQLRHYALSFEVEPLTWYLYWSNRADEDPANSWLRGLIGSVVAAGFKISDAP